LRGDAACNCAEGTVAAAGDIAGAIATGGTSTVYTVSSYQWFGTLAAMHRHTPRTARLLVEDAHVVAGRLLREAWLKRASERISIE